MAFAFCSGERTGRGGAKDGPKEANSAKEERQHWHLEGHNREIAGISPVSPPSKPAVLCSCLPVLPPVQVKDGPPGGTEVSSEPSTKNKLSPVVQHRPDVLLRQHSMPASLQTSGSDTESYRASKGLTADTSQGNTTNMCLSL